MILNVCFRHKINSETFNFILLKLNTYKSNYLLKFYINRLIYLLILNIDVVLC